MQEADELCGRVAIIDQGKTLACDRPVAFKRRIQGRSVVHLQLEEIADHEALLSSLQPVGSVFVIEADGHLPW